MARITYRINVAGTYALLVIHKADARWMILSQKVGNQGMHSSGGKKYRGIVFRNKGLALDLGMRPGFKEFYVFGSQFIGSHKAKVADLGNSE
jgi:hypothetical protein